jgi:AMMECR1 domain-containing protein
MSQVGTHGVRIEYTDPSSDRTRTATFLPEVAPEQGWSKVETIDQLVFKGGFRGVVTDGMRQSIRLTRYQSRKCQVDYDDYLANGKQ